MDEKQLQALANELAKNLKTPEDLSQILALYAGGMTTREITSAFKEMYDADVPPALISKV